MMLTATITIPDQHYDKFMAAFLRAAPIPVTSAGQPLFSQDDWFQRWLELIVRTKFNQGSVQLLSDALTTPTDLLTPIQDP